MDVLVVVVIMKHNRMEGKFFWGGVTSSMFLLPILQDAKEERVKIEIVLSQGDGVMRRKLHDFGMQGTAAAAG